LLARDTVPRLDQIREGFVDAAWRGLFWIAWIALPVNIWRTWEVGWTSSFTIVLIAVAGAFVVHGLRQRLPLGLKSALLLFILWFASLAGVSSFGIAGPSITLLTTNGFVAAMILPQRRALVVIAGGLLTLAVAGTAYVQGWVKPALDLNHFSAMASSWVNLVVVVSGLSVMMSLAVGAFHRAVQGLLLEVAQQRDEIEHLATHDKLTGLPLLRLVAHRAEMALEHARRTGEKVAVMFVDLDGFKAVNDDFGHEAGDHVLAQVATRLRACVRASDTAARVGGDEFMVVLVGLRDAEAAGQIADGIVEAVSQPIAFASTTLTVGASVGIALFPDHAQDTNALRRVADQAMYRVKRAGKNAYAFGEAALQG
jgi:diguanylate cyclase (GGDEF)-like protein